MLKSQIIIELVFTHDISDKDIKNIKLLDKHTLLWWQDKLKSGKRSVDDFLDRCGRERTNKNNKRRSKSSCQIYLK